MIFKKLKINNTLLNNRVVVGPMCQYSAINGRPSSWHFSHLQKLSQLGASMLILESTFPSKNAKISRNDLVLSNNLEKKSFIDLIKYIRKFSNKDDSWLRFSLDKMWRLIFNLFDEKENQSPKI